MTRRILTLAVALGLTATLAWAQMPKAATVVQVRLDPAQVKVKRGGAATASLIAQVQEGFHINSNQPLESYLIPSRVELVEAPAFSLDKINYPKGELKTFDFAPDEKLSVYEGTLKLPLRLRVKRGTPRGSHTVRVAFHYQACNDQFCLPPVKKEATLTVDLE
jgi:hypothetical protein